MAERIEADLTLDASDYNKGLKSADKKTEEFGKKTGGRFGALAGGAIAGVGVAAAAAGVAAAGALGKAAFDVSRQTSEGSKALSAELGALSVGAERYAEVARAAWRNNFGDDVQASFTKIKNLTVGLGEGIADTGELQALTEAAFTLEDAFQADSVQLGQSIGLLKDMGLTGQEAIDFITDGFQRGFDASGDFLETINEYGSVFKDTGADAGELYSILATGQGTGVLGTDKIADSLKEFQIRIREVSSDTTASLLGKFGLDEVKAGVDAGTIDVIDAYRAALDAMRSATDEGDAYNLGQNLFGAQFEDVGVGGFADLNLDLSSQSDVIEETAYSMDLLQERYDTLGGSASGIWRGILDTLSPLTDELVVLAEEWMPQISDWFSGDGKGSVEDFVASAKALWAWLDEFVIPIFAELWDSIATGVQWLRENSELLQNIEASWEKVWSFVKDFFAEFKRLFEERDWAGLGEHIITSIVEFAALAVTTSISNIVAIGMDIWNAIQNIDWPDLGRKIIDGLVAGLKGAKHLILHALRGAFTIGGLNLMDSLGAIVGGGEQASGDEFQGAVNAANAYVAEYYGTGDGGGSTYNVTVNAPSGDGGDIVRAFDRRLEAHGVAAARRQRGQYAYGLGN